MIFQFSMFSPCNCFSKTLRFPYFRAVKLWAKGQGLYSNILGFLGGFSWAILVAKTCTEYPDPNVTPAQMVHNFFKLFSTWEWPHPVLLNPNDVYKACHYKEEAMPIITPVSHINSTFNVTSSYCHLITRKMEEADQLCQKIFEGKEKWEQLFKVSNRKINKIRFYL